MVLKTSPAKLSEMRQRVNELRKKEREEDDNLRGNLITLTKCSRLIPKPHSFLWIRRCPLCSSKVKMIKFFYGLYYLYQCSDCNYEYVTYHPLED